MPATRAPRHVGLDPRAVTRALPHWYLDVKGDTCVAEYLGSRCIAGLRSERRLSLRTFVWEERALGAAG